MRPAISSRDASGAGVSPPHAALANRPPAYPPARAPALRSMFSPVDPLDALSPGPDAWLDALPLDAKAAALFDHPAAASLSPSASPSASASASASPGGHRKRQRPFLADMKLEFAGLELAPPPLAPLEAGSAAAELLRQPAAEFLRALRLPLAREPASLAAATERLARQGFDSAAALAFARPEELQAAGLGPADVAVVAPAARQRFASALAQPPALAAHVPVAQWLSSCGVPAASAAAYAEQLARLGYAHTLELELALHDSRAVALLALGHGRLFLHCAAAAVHAQQLRQQQQQQRLLMAHQPVLFASASAMLQPVDLQRDCELDALIHDGFLDALMDPAPDADEPPPLPQASASAAPPALSPAALPLPIAHTHAHVHAHAHAHTLAGGMLPPAAPLRLLPPDVAQLLFEAVNLPRPNPCRRGKKVYWSVLATNGMKDPRFARLAAFSAAELQHAYLRQFELPAGLASTPTGASAAAAAAAAGKADAWSDENIQQLERAVKDPRCRHLSKVCWEMLATGRTGVDEYAPLSKFSASQLRSRFRSLFGDKRPQKLRQKKELQKVQLQKQQQQQLQLQQQQQQPQQPQQQPQQQAQLQAADAVKKELVLL